MAIKVFRFLEYFAFHEFAGREFHSNVKLTFDADEYNINIAEYLSEFQFRLN